jgi:hypothetical protein
MRTTQAGFKSGRGGEGPADLLERLGPTVLVDVGLKSRAAAGEPPDLPLKRVRALIDTGATGECIDEDLAQSLDLPISEQGWMSGVGGRHRTVIYTLPALHRREARRGRPVASRDPGPAVPAAVPAEL